jgi:hypothetical protein
MVWWLVAFTKKCIQGEDIRIGKPLVNIPCRLCEHGNFAPHVAYRGRPRSSAPEVEENILNVVNRTTESAYKR